MYIRLVFSLIFPMQINYIYILDNILLRSLEALENVEKKMENIAKFLNFSSANVNTSTTNKKKKRMFYNSRRTMNS